MTETSATNCVDARRVSPLNMAEASGSRGGNRTVRYRSALGSAKETMACLDVAVALGYVESVDPAIRGSLVSVRGVLTMVRG